MHAALTALVLLLWTAACAAWCLPRLASGAAALRKPEATLWLLLALLAALYAFPSSAQKSTNPPPPAAAPPERGVIRLYRDDGTGRLVPLDAEILEVSP